TFIALLARGFWPILTDGKRPVGNAWGLERWTLERALAVFKTRPRPGVGVCLGPGRGPGGKWLGDIEGDGPEAEESRAALFGGEVSATVGWGSVRGGHQLLSFDGERLGEI